MTFGSQFSIASPWLHDGSVQDAIAWRDRIVETPDLGYVYLLALSGGHTKVGSTAYFPERLNAHLRDSRRCGIAIDRCMVTRPAFNYREVERAAIREFTHKGYFGEVFVASITEIANFVAFHPLAIVAPEGYGQSRQSGHRLLTSIMTQISEGLGIALPEEMQRHVQCILDRHTALGRETGLSERDATLNALAVIEAHTGLDLNTFRNVLVGVA